MTTSETPTPTIPAGPGAVRGRLIAHEARIATLEVRVQELYHWVVVILGVFIATVLLALGYAIRSYLKS